MVLLAHLKYLFSGCLVGVLGLLFAVTGYSQVSLTLEELLEYRFEELALNCTPQECQERICIDPEGCSDTIKVEQEVIIESVFDSFLNEVSILNEIVCDLEDTSFVLSKQIVDLTKFSLPFEISRVRICGGMEYYLPSSVIGDRLNPFEIVERISVTTYDQKFQILIDSIETEVDLATFLDIIFYDTNSPRATLSTTSYIGCGELICITPRLNCVSDLAQAHEERLVYLQERTKTYDVKHWDYPLKIFSVGLCESQSIWLTEEELGLFSGTDYLELKKVVVQSYDESIQIDAPCINEELLSEISISTIDPTCEDPNSGSLLVSSFGQAADIFERYSINGGQTWQISPLFQNLVDGEYEISLSNSSGSIQRVLTDYVVLSNKCQENNLVTCSDGIDNDGDGLTDCMDTDCQRFRFTVETIDDNLCDSLGNGEIRLSSHDLYEFSIDGGTSYTSIGVFKGLISQSYDVLIRNKETLCTVDTTIMVDGIDLSTKVVGNQLKDGSVFIRLDYTEQEFSDFVDNNNVKNIKIEVFGQNSSGDTSLVQDVYIADPKRVNADNWTFGIKPAVISEFDSLFGMIYANNISCNNRISIKVKSNYKTQEVGCGNTPDYVIDESAEPISDISVCPIILVNAFPVELDMESISNVGGGFRGYGKIKMPFGKEVLKVEFSFIEINSACQVTSGEIYGMQSEVTSIEDLVVHELMEENGMGICIEPSASERFSEDGFDPVTGLSARGFNSDGIHNETGTIYDRYGFDADGDHYKTNSPYNEDGCSIRGVDKHGEKCELTVGGYFEATSYLQEYETQLTNEIGRFAMEYQDEIGIQMEDKGSDCDLLRAKLNDLFSSSTVIDRTLIEGLNREYVDEDLSLHFLQAPLQRSGGFSDNHMLRIEEVHVELYYCDLELHALQTVANTVPGLFDGDGLSSGLLTFLFDEIKNWTEYEYYLYSNDDVKRSEWITQKIKEYLSQYDNQDNLLPIATKESAKKVINNLINYSDKQPEAKQIFRQKYIERDAQSNTEALKIANQINNRQTDINGVPIALYFDQIYRKKTTSKSSEEHNLLPLKILNKNDKKPVGIFLDNVVFTPNGASLSAYAVINNVEGGGALVFHAQNVNFGVGGLIDESNSMLKLYEDESIRLNNASRLTINSDNTGVKWNCYGFQGVELSASIEFCPNFIVPFIGNSPHYDESYTLNFDAEIDSWNEFYIEINSDNINHEAYPFVLTRYPEVVWTFENIAVDFHSGLSPTLNTHDNALHFKEGISSIIEPEWRGFFIGELSAYFGYNFHESTSGGANNIAKIGVYNTFIDDSGLNTYAFYEGDLLSIDEGNLGGWAFSIDGLSLQVESNHLNGGGFKGQIRLPFVNEDISYVAQIYPFSYYKFTVILEEDLSSELFLSTIQLERNSQLFVKKDNDGFHIKSDLSGTLSIGIPESLNIPIRNLPSDVQFQSFQVSNRSPYFSPGIWGVKTERNIESPLIFSNFPVRIESVKPYKPNDVNTVGLGFDVSFNLVEELGISALGGFGIEGILSYDASNRQVWTYEDFIVKEIAIDAMIGTFAHVKGYLEWDNDATWGNYFRGQLDIEVLPLGVGVESIGHFGSKESKNYFYVDFLVDIPFTVPVGPLNFDKFGAGLYYHMTYEVPELDDINLCDLSKELAPGLGESLAGGRYLINFSTNVGFAGIGGFNIANVDEIFNGRLSLNAEFGNRASLQKISFGGFGQMLTSPNCIKTNAAITAVVNMVYDASQRSFDASLIAKIEASAGIRVEVDINGRLKIAPDEWFLWLGTPVQDASKGYMGPIMASLDAIIVDVNAKAYFCIGTNVPDMPPLPQKVREIAYKFQQNTSVRSSGFGIIFGASLTLDAGINIAGIVQAELEAGGGFDVMLRKYNNVFCSNTGKEVGINGWYGSGQVWAYFEGKLKVVGVNLASAGVAAVLQMQGPNPFYGQATVGVKVKLLFFAIKKSLAIKVGRPCDFGDVPPADEFGGDIILAIVPTDQSTDISPIQNIEVTFALAESQSFESYDLNNNLSEYLFKLKDVHIVGGRGQNIYTENYFNDSRYELSIRPLYGLLEDEEIHVTVVIDLYKNDVNVGSQEKTVVFHTGGRLDFIPEENVQFAYPYDRMQHYHPQQTPNNFIQLKIRQDNLFDVPIEEEQFIRLTNELGHSWDLDYSYSGGRVTYSIPFEYLDTKQLYTIEIIRRSISGREDIVYKQNFTTSKYINVEEKFLSEPDEYWSFDIDFDLGLWDNLNWGFSGGWPFQSYFCPSFNSRFTPPKWEAFSLLGRENLSDRELEDFYTFELMMPEHVRSAYLNHLIIKPTFFEFPISLVGILPEYKILANLHVDEVVASNYELEPNLEQTYYHTLELFYDQSCKSNIGCDVFSSVACSNLSKMYIDYLIDNYNPLPLDVTYYYNIKYSIPGSNESWYYQIEAIKLE